MADDVIERLVIVEQRSAAAHQRVDKLEASLATDLKEINAELKDMVKWMHEQKGEASGRGKVIAALTSIAALVGGVLGALIPLFFK